MVYFANFAALLCLLELWLGLFVNCEIISRMTVTGIQGDKVELKCRILETIHFKDYGNLSWFKSPRRLLTRGVHRITPDKRFSIGQQSIIDANDFNLIINPVKDADSGEYKCGYRKGHTMRLKVFMLMVKIRPQITMHRQSAMELEEGKMLKLTCNASGKPQPRVFWFYKISSSTHHKVPVESFLRPFSDHNMAEIHVLGATLYISKVHRNMTGYYMCLAANQIPPDAKYTFHLLVKFKPEVTMTNPYIEQLPGFHTVLECQIRASPMTTVQWIHKNSAISPMLCGPLENKNLDYCLVEHVDKESGQSGYMTSKLTVFYIENDDYGQYKCLMENSMGRGSATSEIRQQEIKPPKDENHFFFEYGNTKTVDFVLNGEDKVTTQPNPLHQFQKSKSTNIPNGRGSTLKQATKMLLLWISLVFWMFM